MKKTELKQPNFAPPQKFYSNEALERAWDGMQKHCIDGRFGIKSWESYMASKGAIKRYGEAPNGSQLYSVVLPFYETERNLEEQVHRYIKKKTYAKKMHEKQLQVLADQHVAGN